MQRSQTKKDLHKSFMAGAYQCVCVCVPVTTVWSLCAHALFMRSLCSTVNADVCKMAGQAAAL